MLVDYPDSSSESDLDNKTRINPARKRKAQAEPMQAAASRRPPPPPPPPPTFHSLYTAAARTSTSDDPSLHDGRTRQIPHVVGNWPTHVYLEWYPAPKEVTLVGDIIRQASLKINAVRTISGAETLIHPFLRSDLGALLPLHVSLSAPLVLRAEQKARFQENLQAQLEQSHVNSFMVNIAGLEWVSNHDQTRFFLVLRLSQPKDDQLNKLLSACNKSAQQFGLTQLYVDPGEAGPQADNNDRRIPDRSSSFHISIAWTLQRPTEEATDSLSQYAVDRCRELEIKFDRLKLKMGNNVFDILLDNCNSGRDIPTAVESSQEFVEPA
ncbi:uncharacterized protein A1O9_04875 [Exophiala aquamarina CBS 119918]|uniref:U6 snRNA phosphodiesterase n=1 Tax=Exophiala aquamarina CBS 119918 TaxID=1182545 RepID=A0A072PWP4_9EURO|nr:uncharacterized protein A1O9_04875 [Exophiala aquamarina CBS 119918]KEF60025.1 hypothetical protein A1O9_04875 [Exophiala aquamarina CBS 119918]